MNAQQLKNSILQMAVQGKLVPQDPNDEPASVLLERIRAEKEELIKQGKIKKEKNPSFIFKGADNIPYEKVGKNEPVSIADEIPFEIPDSWEWVRLGTLLSVISDGTHKTPTYVDNGIPFLSVQNISKGYFDFTKIKYITLEEHLKLIERIKPQRDDILLCRIGTLGKAIKCTLDFEFSIFVSLGLLRPVNSILADFLTFTINSPVGDQWIEENKVGGGTHTFKINLRDIPHMLLPIPPLAEQLRIQEKFSELEPLLEAYDVAEEKIEKLNSEFPERLKKSILQYAVQGKLVPQDSDDEPADVLLERIRSEKQRLIKEGKIKKDKLESVIFRRDNSHYEKRGFEEVCIDAELPFDIPDSWCWARLDNIITVRGGKRLPKGEKLLESPTDHVYIRVTDMKNNSVDLNDLHYIDDKVYREISNYIITKDDIYIVIVGSTIGKVGIIPNELDGMNLTENAARLTPYLVDKEYLLLALQTEYLQRQFLDKTNQVGQPKLALIRLKTSLIPIPPLEEQKRIAQMYKYLLLPVSDL